MSGTLPFAATLALVFDSFSTPAVGQVGYVPLAVTNSDGSAPTISDFGVATPNATFTVLANTGPSATEYPYAAVFTALNVDSTVSYNVLADGLQNGTIAVTVAPTAPETVAPGVSVELPLGTAFPAGGF